MSLMVIPTFLRSFCTAKIGATPMISGAMAATASATHSSCGVTPSSFAREAFITTTPAPASLIPEEFPGVTLPPSRKAGFRPASDSAVVPGRGCSSVKTGIGSPFFCGTSKATI